MKIIKTAKFIDEFETGGNADGRPNSEFDSRQLSKGRKIEQEHVKDGDWTEEEKDEIADKIAKDHMEESEDFADPEKGAHAKYYDLLEEMERVINKKKEKKSMKIIETGIYKKAQFNMDAFTMQYLETALWSSNGQGGNPLDEQYGLIDFSKETFQEMIRDCSDFQKQNADLLQRWYTEAGENQRSAGHDFWLTRNGHGAGFWDRHMDEPGREIGDQLTQKAKEYGSYDIYVGDDGKLYGG